MSGAYSGLSTHLVERLTQLLVLARVAGREAHVLGDRVADSALVGAAQAGDDFVGVTARHGEDHLVVLSQPEDAVAGAGQDVLRLVVEHGADDDLRAVDPPGGDGPERAAAAVERGLDQP